MNNSLIIRPINKSEIGFLDKMLYDAIFVPAGNERLPDNIIEHPEISKYIKDFGREGDSCLVAEINGELVGAVWTRRFNVTNKAYGFVDSDTPELSMAVYEQFRKEGIGTILLKTMIKALTDEGYKQISLSVDKINYAYNLYKKIGFKDYKSVDDSMTMIIQLNNSD
jgi:ribosomal protein S18 acetylase RimI-like enzyme